MFKSVRARVVGRLIGASALALAIAAGPIAGPASAVELEQFAGTGTGYALRVTLDLRGSLLEPILTPVLGPVVQAATGKPFTGVIDQYFIKTSSEADASNTKARSALAEGLLNLDVVEATKVGQTVEKTVQNIALPSEDLSILSGTVGNLLASVLGGPNVGGIGELENLAVGLPLEDLDLPELDSLLGAILDDLVGEGGVVTELLDDVLGDLSGDLVGQLTGTIDGLTGSLGAPALGNLAGGLGLPVGSLENPTDVTSALTELLDVEGLLEMITGLLNGSLLEGDLAELQGLINITGTQKTPDGTKAVAGSAASLQSLQVLGGLVDVSLLNLKSTSEAAGVKGSAKNTSDCSIADVNIGDGALAISLDGKTISINGTPVPVVGELVGQVKGLVDGLLNALGIDVGLCEAADVQVDPAGRSASQSVSALRVELAPLGLFRLIIDPTVQTAVAAQPQVGTETTSTPDGPTPSLPKTGAGMAVSIFGGLGLAVGAIMIRRRFV